MDFVLVFNKGQLKERILSTCIISYFSLFGCCTGIVRWLQLAVNYLLNRDTELSSFP